MATPERATRDLYLGIDLGGTKIITAVVDGEGRIIARDYQETEAQGGPAAVVGQITEAATNVIAESGVNSAGITGVGVAAPGPIDAESGVVTAPPNLPGWKDVPLKQLIQDQLGLPTALENDANAAALAEHRFGAGQGTKHMIYVTASTGIGGGFILDGELYAGATGAAGEIGHMTIIPHGPLCGCGNQGCLEALASGRAIAREARERVRQGAPGLIADLADGDLERISAKLVAEAADQGDTEAANILDEAMTYLGIGMANLVNLFNPELIVIGGGLTKMGERLFGPVRSIIDQRAFPASAQAVRVAPAELGDDAGVLGAAAVAMLSQH
jgi:glucokinase